MGTVKKGKSKVVRLAQRSKQRMPVWVWILIVMLALFALYQLINLMLFYFGVGFRT